MDEHTELRLAITRVALDSSFFQADSRSRAALRAATAASSFAAVFGVFEVPPLARGTSSSEGRHFPRPQLAGPERHWTQKARQQTASCQLWLS